MIPAALYTAFGAPVFLGLFATCGVVAHRFADSGRPWWPVYSAAPAIVLPAGPVLLNLAFSQYTTFMLIDGLIQRFTLIVGLAWLAAFAVQVLRLPAGTTGTRF